ncbi:hypothetical protein P3342_008879 [Pyrenophora teres f. teres]|nr:hypothetical protein P3342_008879 [Pyrenophora teres f. teres]
MVIVRLQRIASDKAQTSQNQQGQPSLFAYIETLHHCAFRPARGLLIARPLALALTGRLAPERFQHPHAVGQPDRLVREAT